MKCLRVCDLVTQLKKKISPHDAIFCSSLLSHSFNDFSVYCNSSEFKVILTVILAYELKHNIFSDDAVLKYIAVTLFSSFYLILQPYQTESWSYSQISTINVRAKNCEKIARD